VLDMPDHGHAMRKKPTTLETCAGIWKRLAIGP